MEGLLRLRIQKQSAMRKTPLRRSSHPGATARRRRGLTIAVPPVMVPAGMALPGAEVQMAPTGAARAIAGPKGEVSLVVVLMGAVLMGAVQARRIIGLTDLPPEVHVDLVDRTVVRDGDLDRTDVDLDLAGQADRGVDLEWEVPVGRGT